MKDILQRFIEDQTYFNISLTSKMSLTSMNRQIECSLFKPSQQFQVCTKNILNMLESIERKITNSQPKIWLNSRRIPLSGLTFDRFLQSVHSIQLLIYTASILTPSTARPFLLDVLDTAFLTRALKGHHLWPIT